MSYTQQQMLYKYTWTALADHDNPYYRRGSDYTQLNRDEGYEMHYFINHLCEKFKIAANETNGNKIEKMIKDGCPSHLRSHLKIEQWIRANWSRY